MKPMQLKVDLGGSKSKLIKEINELKWLYETTENERVSLMEGTRRLMQEIEDAKAVENHLRNSFESEMNAHNETRRKYAEALKKLIEMKEKLAGKVGGL